MSLTLSVLTYRNQPPPRAISATFTGSGGTIGRLEQNELVLPDPERVISRTHARVEFRSGSYFITALGQNLIDLNGRPLGAGETVQLSSGDKLIIGDYSVVADVQFEEPEPALAGTLSPPSKLFEPLEPGFVPEPESNDALGIPLTEGELLAAEGKKQPAGPAPEFLRGTQQRDAVPGFLEPLPRARPGPVSIPDDYDLLKDESSPPDTGEDRAPVARHTDPFVLDEDDRTVIRSAPGGGRIVPKHAGESVLLATSVPRGLRRREGGVVHFVAYVETREREIKQRLKQIAHGDVQTSIGIKPAVSTRWRIGTLVTVCVSGEHLSVTPPEQRFEWDGRESFLNFEIRPHSDAPTGWTVLRFEVLIENLPVAFIGVQMKIAFLRSRKHSISATTPAKTAFASYASADRSRVMDQLSALCAYDNALDVFTDCLDMKPGAQWQRLVERQIAERDLFFLFWSLNASRSKWVTWEWQTAKASRGLHAIRPVPLDDPQEVPPPAELSSLHFLSRYLLARAHPLKRRTRRFQT